MDRGADAMLDIGTTPLLRAARGADVAAMKVLLAHGALVDLPQVTGATPLMVAVGLAVPTDTRGKFRTELDALAAAQVLLDAGADVNARDTRGRTPLHAAAAQGYSDIAKFLVERGADLKAADNDGVLPVDAALGKLKGGAGAGRRALGHREGAERARRGALSVVADPSMIQLEAPTARHAEELIAAVRRSRRLHGGWITNAPATREQYPSLLRYSRTPGRISRFVRIENEVSRGPSTSRRSCWAHPLGVSELLRVRAAPARGYMRAGSRR